MHVLINNNFQISVLDCVIVSMFLYAITYKYHIENKNIDSMFSVEISRNNFKIKSQQFF